VDYFFERLGTQGKDARALAGVKIAVVGENLQSLKQRSLQPDFIPPDFVADSLVEHFRNRCRQKKFYFRELKLGGEVLVKS